ncbi:MAG TPA: hypothetical protein VG457_20340 [Planctomycetota bacterium]|jgi:hypothetical protein|nr:hypothetical protein [Planctomycetota bacterium]
MTEPALPLAILAVSVLLACFVAAMPRRRPLHRARLRPLPVPPRTWSLESLLSLLHLTPFDHLGPQAQLAVVERLRAADRGPLSMREHGRINLLLGEIALSTGDREEARRRYRAALRWDPRLPIRRTVERLDAPPVLSSSSRRAA